jgi:hypothetical protein
LSSGNNPEGNDDGVVIIIITCNQFYAANSMLGIPEMFRKYVYIKIHQRCELPVLKPVSEEGYFDMRAT